MAAPFANPLAPQGLAEEAHGASGGTTDEHDDPSNNSKQALNKDSDNGGSYGDRASAGALELDSLLDPSTVISFLRRMLPPEPQSADGQAATATTTKAAAAAAATAEVAAEEGGELAAREEVGCILWDLSSCEEHARFLLQHYAVSVVEGVLLHYGGDVNATRVVEVSVGILANIVCHKELVTHASLQSARLQALVLQLLCTSTDAAVLTELCRLLSALCRQRSPTHGTEQARGEEKPPPSSPQQQQQHQQQQQQQQQENGEGEHDEGAAWWLVLSGSMAAQQKLLWICNNALHRPLQERVLELLLVLAVRGPPIQAKRNNTNNNKGNSSNHDHVHEHHHHEGKSAADRRVSDAGKRTEQVANVHSQQQQQQQEQQPPPLWSSACVDGVVEVLRTSLQDSSAGFVVDTALRTLEALAIQESVAALCNANGTLCQILLVMITKLQQPHSATKPRAFFTPTPATPATPATPSIQAAVSNSGTTHFHGVKIASGFCFGAASEGLFESSLFVVSTLLNESQLASCPLLEQLACWDVVHKLMRLVAIAEPSGKSTTFNEATEEVNQESYVEAWRVLSKVFLFWNGQIKRSNFMHSRCFLVDGDDTTTVETFFELLDTALVLLESNSLTPYADVEECKGALAYVECICKCVRNIISHNKQLVDAKLKVVPCSDSSATENAVVVQLSDVLLSKLEEFVERAQKQ